MEFAYQNMTCEGICGEITKQFEVDCRISELVDENVVKILCIDALSTITGYDLSNGEVKFRGKINYKIAYVNEDNDVKSINYMCDFSDSITSGEICATDKICLDSEVIGSTISGLDIIKICSTLKVSVSRVQITEFEMVDTTNEDCYYKTKEVECNTYITTSASSFEVEDEYMVNKPIDEIVMMDTSVLLCDSEVGENKLTISGDVVVNITYKTEGGLFSKCFNIPFYEEMEGAGNENTRCYPKVNIDNAKILLTDNDCTLKVKVTIDARCMLFDVKTEQVVVDMYSMCNRLELEKKEVKITNFLDNKCYTERINTEAKLDESITGNIVGLVCPKNIVNMTKTEDDILIIDGKVTVCMLYRVEDRINSVELVAPYSVELGETDGEDYTAKGIVLDINAKIKNENTISVDALLKFAVSGCKSTTCEVVCGVEEKGELELKNCAISIIIIDRQKTFFDVAKTLATTPEELERQNPSLIEPLKLGDKLYFYRKLNKNYV